MSMKRHAVDSFLSKGEGLYHATLLKEASTRSIFPRVFRKFSDPLRRSMNSCLFLTFQKN